MAVGLPTGHFFFFGSGVPAGTEGFVNAAEVVTGVGVAGGAVGSLGIVVVTMPNNGLGDLCPQKPYPGTPGFQC